MIGTAKKPFEEILRALEGYQEVAVVGCDGCAKVCLTGGTDEVAAMAAPGLVGPHSPGNGPG